MRNDDSFLSFCIFLLLPVFVIIGIVIGGIRQIYHHYEVNNCRTYAVVTDRQTKFVDFNFWNFKCLTPTKDGKWIGTDQLREM